LTLLIFPFFVAVEALTAKTHWTKEDLAALHEEFKRVDKDKSGELDFKGTFFRRVFGGWR
jgi:Ca2+-binding EF-hand superfamily protein